MENLAFGGFAVFAVAASIIIISLRKELKASEKERMMGLKPSEYMLWMRLVDGLRIYYGTVMHVGTYQTPLTGKFGGPSILLYPIHSDKALRIMIHNSHEPMLSVCRADGTTYLMELEEVDLVLRTEWEYLKDLERCDLDL